jgi:uncharacterized protein YoxC
MFDTIYKWSKLVAVVCVVPITIFLCIFLHSLSIATTQVATTAKELPQKVDGRIDKLQKDVLGKIDTVQNSLNTEVTTLATLSDGRLGKIEKDAVTTLGTLTTNVNTQLTTANNTLSTQLGTANTNLATVTTAYASVPAQVGQQYTTLFGSYFDCAKNKLCLQGQASDTLFAVRQSSRDTSILVNGLNDTFPKISNNINAITETFSADLPTITSNIGSITKNINSLTKPHWYDRVIGYGLNGAVLYRSLNPVTSLTITGAQVIASQK